MSNIKLMEMEDKNAKFEYYLCMESNIYRVKLTTPTIYLNGDERMMEYSE